MTEELPTPKIQFRAPTFTGSQPENAAPNEDRAINPLVARIQDEVYSGSFRRRSRPQSVASGVSTPVGSVPPSPRASVSQGRLQDLLENADTQQETYGLEELRDGFFDGFFFSSSSAEQDAWQKLSSADDGDKSSSLQQLARDQINAIYTFIHKVTRTRAGIKLTKSFLSFFVAYIICLIPAARAWLGRYNYLMVLSAIVNHSGRTVGSQIDGVIMAVLGGAIGLGWGSLALYVSTATEAARSAYGGVLVAFLVPFAALLSFVRCTFVRLYQAVICAGIAICYTCLADTSTQVMWHKIFSFGIPWLLGQCISLTICVLFIPDAGSRPIAVALHRSMMSLQQALDLPRRDSRELRRDLAWNITNLSDAVRDLTLDISVTRYDPKAMPSLRNLIQSVIRAILVIKPDTPLFDLGAGSTQDLHAMTNGLQRVPSTLALMIADKFSHPTRQLLTAIVSTIATCDASLMDISGYRRYLGPSLDVSADVVASSQELAAAIEAFDRADESLLKDPELPEAYSDHPEVVQLLLFAHPIRLVAGRVISLAAKVSEINNAPFRFHRPSYPFIKALSRTNAQVRHDRGGLTAGFYFRTKRQIERTLEDLQSKPYVPLGLPSQDPMADGDEKGAAVGEVPRTTADSSTERTIRHRIWEILHSLQGFESRFAIKVVIATTTLSIPAWLPQSANWWNEQEVWWAVVMVWLMMHPRIGGNLQDLVTRTATALIGAVWGGFAYAADDGNPYVIAVFALIFMVPMMYRFTQSSHPRSGLAGCISFTVVSLSAYTENANGDIFHFTWTRACAFMVGVVAAVVVNWMIWPFVARHELRKSLSTMMQHLSVIYRSVVARYIYYLETHPPSAMDVEKSEMLEGRLREAFIRIEQLLALSKHEIRLREPFNAKPYELLIAACEDFFADLVAVRQSSLYFQPRLHQVSGPEGQKMNQSLLSYRRDAVATILMNLYILAGALKIGRPVPRYMPSAAMARKRLLDRMAELEAEQEEQEERLALQKTLTKGKRWANVYQYAFNAALTDIVERLEDLQRITKLVVGERGFDLPPEDPSI